MDRSSAHSPATVAGASFVGPRRPMSVGPRMRSSPVDLAGAEAPAAGLPCSIGGPLSVAGVVVSVDTAAASFSL